MPSLAQAGIGFLASAAGALVAGYAGVWFGVAKLRRQRAFERRLDWYLAMIRVMQELVSTGILSNYVRDESERMRLAKESNAAIIRFHQLSNEARLYVSKRADEALTNVLAALDRVGPSLGSSDLAEHAKAKVESIRFFQYGITVLTNDVRKEFGLRALPPRPKATGPLPPMSQSEKREPDAPPPSAA